jgi:hypothetical protein
LKIVLGTLNDKGEDLATFLEPRIGGKPEVGGGELNMEDSALKQGLRSRHIKTYVKRFLYQQGVRKDYRVLVENGELLIIEIEREEEEEEEEEKGKKEAAKEEPKKEEAEAAKETEAAEATTEKETQGPAS